MNSREASRRSDTFQRISDELRQNLTRVAIALEHASSVGETKSYVVFVKTELLNELGMALMKIFCGGNAREVFRQDERNKPKMGFDHVRCAYTFWVQRARVPDAPVAAAVKAAKRASGLKISSARVQRLAREMRDVVLAKIETDIREGFDVSTTLSLRDLNALRERLKRKSKGQHAANT